MKIAIEAKRWAAVRKALGWSYARMWTHFYKTTYINICIPFPPKRRIRR